MPDASFAPAPLSRGARLRVLTRGGREILDALLPAGALNRSGQGWKVSPRGTSAVYLDRTGASGIDKLSLSWGSPPATGGVKFSAVARSGAFRVGADDLPLAIEISFDPTRTVTGQCAQRAFSGGPDRPFCAISPSATALVCR